MGSKLYHFLRGVMQADVPAKAKVKAIQDELDRIGKGKLED